MNMDMDMDMDMNKKLNMNAKMKKHADYYRKHLLNDIMPFWDERCIDTDFGGYQINFDRFGNPTDTDKYNWFQARQTYVYGFLYNEIENRETWLNNARHGYMYLKHRAYQNDGRFAYHSDQKGSVKVGTISVFTDCYAVQAISEYFRAAGGDDVFKFLNECYDALERNIMDPLFKDIYENTWSEKFIWHDLYLTALSAADTASDTLGPERAKKLIDYCLDKIWNWFVRKDYILVFEAVGRDKTIYIDDVHGSFINPGHALESMWFCLNIANKRNDTEMIQKALEVVKWMANVGIDTLHGGIFSYLNAKGGTPDPIDWFKATDSLWDDKVWWVHAESLACFAISYALSGGDDYYMERFEALHEFCREYFYDDVHGEWYERLHRDGSVKNPDKGTMWKSAYHLARSVIFVIKYFDKEG